MCFHQRGDNNELLPGAPFQLPSGFASIHELNLNCIIVLVPCSPLCQKWVTVFLSPESDSISVCGSTLCLCASACDHCTLLMMHSEVHHVHIQSACVCVHIHIEECAHTHKLIMNHCQPLWRCGVRGRERILA